MQAFGRSGQRVNPLASIQRETNSIHPSTVPETDPETLSPLELRQRAITITALTAGLYLGEQASPIGLIQFAQYNSLVTSKALRSISTGIYALHRRLDTFAVLQRLFSQQGRARPIS